MKAFGPQGWWPVTPVGARFPVYTPGFFGPLSERGIFEVCVGAILTQNTAWTNVEKALASLNGADLMSPEALASCPLHRLEKAVRSSGYFRQKARRLREFFRRVLSEHPGGFEEWFSGTAAARLREELLSYRGVGPETADSIALYAAGKPSFVIDAYTRRVAERLGVAGGLSYGGWKALFEAALPPDAEVYREYHALLVRLCKDFCTKSRPRCASCPLKRICKK